MNIEMHNIHKAFGKTPFSPGSPLTSSQAKSTHSWVKMVRENQL